MKIIVGLGNPGKSYERTRHNTGFMTMDLILDELHLTLDKKGFKALYTIYNYKGEKIIFVKPQTYMNLSGEAVRDIVNYYGGSYEDVVVIHDDLDLPVGKIRIRKSGSSGGQKGMDNIISLLGNKDIKRIRIGIGNDKDIPTADYVLSKFHKDELKLFKDSIIKAKDAIIYYLDNNFEKVMSKYNG